MTPIRHAASPIVLIALVVVAALVTACGGTTSSPTPAASPSPGASPAVTAAASRGPTPIPDPTATPLGDRLVVNVSVAQAPCAMAVDATSAWVTSNATGVLERIDPLTNMVVDRVTLDSGPCGIAVGSDGRIWVAELGPAGAVVAVDPATLKITARIDGIGPQLWDLKAGFGSVWVADRSAKTVLRINPKTAKVQATINVGPQPSGLAIMPDGVWVTDDIDGKVRRLDPTTNTVTVTADVGGAPSWFADDGASNLVIAERGRGIVVPLDPATGAQGEQVTGWTQPLDGTVLGGQAWIPDGTDRVVGVITLDGSAETVRYVLPGAINPFVAEPAFGDIWVLDFGGTTIWRIRP